MRIRYNKRAGAILNAIRQRKTWKRVASGLMAGVMVFTTYSLILPAATLGSDQKVLDCGLVVHQHTEDCYDDTGILICNEADFVVHKHDPIDCYDEDGILVCELPEIEAHTHDETCYTNQDPEEGMLTCGKEEIILHTHTTDKTEDSEYGCYDADGNLTCGQCEVLEHVHADGCFITQKEWQKIQENEAKEAEQQSVEEQTEEAEAETTETAAETESAETTPAESQSTEALPEESEAAATDTPVEESSTPEATETPAVDTDAPEATETPSTDTETPEATETPAEETDAPEVVETSEGTETPKETEPAQDEEETIEYLFSGDNLLSVGLMGMRLMSGTSDSTLTTDYPSNLPNVQEVLDIDVGFTGLTPDIKAGKIVWYRWTVPKPWPAGHTLQFTSNDTRDTYCYIYRSDGTQLAYNDDGAGSRQFILTCTGGSVESFSGTSVTLQPGETYYFGVKYYNGTVTGSYVFTFDYDPTTHVSSGNERTCSVCGEDISNLEGVCGTKTGDPATWTLYLLDDEDDTSIKSGDLRITGSGAMSTYSSGSSVGGTYASKIRSKTSRIFVGDNITSVGSYAFHAMTRATTAYLGESVASIYTGAFNGDTMLYTITLNSSNLATCSSDAFTGCSKISKIVIGQGVDTLHYSFFHAVVNASNNNISLSFVGPNTFTYSGTSITVGGLTFVDGTKYYVDENGAVYILTDTLASERHAASRPEESDAPSQESTDPSNPQYDEVYQDEVYAATLYYVPTTFTNDQCDALLAGTYLTTVTDEENNITTLHHATFNADGTDYLVTDIGEGAFAENTTITAITIPDNICNIEDAAFYKCTNLESVNGKTQMNEVYASIDGVIASTAFLKTALQSTTVSGSTEGYESSHQFEINKTSTDAAEDAENFYDFKVSVRATSAYLTEEGHLLTGESATWSVTLDQTDKSGIITDTPRIYFQLNAECGISNDTFKVIVHDTEDDTTKTMFDYELYKSYVLQGQEERQKVTAYFGKVTEPGANYLYYIELSDIDPADTVQVSLVGGYANLKEGGDVTVWVTDGSQTVAQDFADWVAFDHGGGSSTDTSDSIDCTKITWQTLHTQFNETASTYNANNFKLSANGTDTDKIWVSNLGYSVNLKKETGATTLSYGNNFLEYARYTSTLVLPEGFTLADDVLAAIRNGSCSFIHDTIGNIDIYSDKDYSTLIATISVSSSYTDYLWLTSDGSGNSRSDYYITYDETTRALKINFYLENKDLATEMPLITTYITYGSSVIYADQNELVDQAKESTSGTSLTLNFVNTFHMEEEYQYETTRTQNDAHEHDVSVPLKKTIQGASLTYSKTAKTCTGNTGSGYAVYLGDDVTFYLNMKNESAFTYTDLVGVKDTMEALYYIKPSNMDKMFSETDGDQLTINIQYAVQASASGQTFTSSTDRNKTTSTIYHDVANELLDNHIHNNSCEPSKYSSIGESGVCPDYWSLSSGDIALENRLDLIRITKVKSDEGSASCLKITLWDDAGYTGSSIADATEAQLTGTYQTYYVAESDAALATVLGSSEGVTRYDSIESAFQALGIYPVYQSKTGYSTAFSTLYTCTWSGTKADNAEDSATTYYTPVYSGTTKTYTVYATVKTFYMMPQKDFWEMSGFNVTAYNYLYTKTRTSGYCKQASAYEYVYSDYQLEKLASIEGKSVNSTSTIHEGDVMLVTNRLTRYVNTDYGYMPLVDRITGVELVMVRQDLNTELASVGFDTYTYNGVEYYILNKPGTYEKVNFSTTENGNFFADSVTITGDETNKTGLETIIKWYVEQGSKSTTGSIQKSYQYYAIIDPSAISSDYLAASDSTYVFNDEVWFGDHAGRRLWDAIGYDVNLLVMDKKIVDTPTDSNGDGDIDNPLGETENYAHDPSLDNPTSSSYVSEGETVTYRLRLESLGSGFITVTGSSIYDLLPQSVNSYWTKDNVSITYQAVAATENQVNQRDTASTVTVKLGDEVIYASEPADEANPVGTKQNTTVNGDTSQGWSISTGYYTSGNVVTASKPSSGSPVYQKLSWDSNFSITLHGALYIYVTVTYPQNITADEAADTAASAQWDELTAVYGCDTLYNYFHVFNLTDSVTHYLSVEGSAYLQKGVWKTGTLSSTGSFVENTDSEDERLHYTNKSNTNGAVLYYIALYNDGNGRLYLNDIQDVLPQGFTFYRSYSLACYYADSGSSNYRYLNYYEGYYFGSYNNACVQLREDSDGAWANKSVTFKTASITPYSNTSSSTNISTTEGGQQRVTFKLSSTKYGNSISKDTNGKCYLRSGEAIVIAYYACTNGYDDSLDEAVNRVTMPYYSYSGEGVTVPTNLQFTLKNSGGRTLNDGEGSLLSTDTAADTTNYKEQMTQWGFDVESATNRDGTGCKNWLVSDVTVNRGKAAPGLLKTCDSTQAGVAVAVGWTITATDNGTDSLRDYTITDEMMEPYRFEGDVKYQLYASATTAASSQITLFSITRDINDSSKVTLTYTELISSKTTTTTSRTTDLTINGDAVAINNSTFGMIYVSITTAPTTSTDEVPAEILSIRFADMEKAAIAPGGKGVLKLSTRNWTGPYENKTFINTSYLTPMSQDFVHEEVNQGTYVESLTIPDALKTTSEQESGTTLRSASISSCAQIMVSYGYATMARKTLTEQATVVDEEGSTVFENLDNNAYSDDTSQNLIYLQNGKDSVFRYSLEVSNSGGTTKEAEGLQKLVVIDNLPEAGSYTNASGDTFNDHTTFYNTGSRNSQFRVDLPDDVDTMQFQVTVTLGKTTTTLTEDQYTLQFSKQTEFEYKANSTLWSGATMTSDDGWYTVEEIQTDDTLSFSDMRSFRVVVNDPDCADNLIPAKSTVRVMFNGVVSGENVENIYGLEAWNSFGYYYQLKDGETLRAAPQNVGIKISGVPFLSKSLVKVSDWSGTASDQVANSEATTSDTDQTFTFLIYEGEALDFDSFSYTYSPDEYNAYYYVGAYDYEYTFKYEGVNPNGDTLYDEKGDPYYYGTESVTFAQDFKDYYGVDMVGLDDYWSDESLADAIDKNMSVVSKMLYMEEYLYEQKRSFTVKTITVPAGSSLTEAVALDGLYEYSPAGITFPEGQFYSEYDKNNAPLYYTKWQADTSEAWQWQNGQKYTIVEIPADGYVNIGYTLNGTTTSSMTFTYNRSYNQTITATNAESRWTMQVNKVNETNDALPNAYFAIYSPDPSDMIDISNAYKTKLDALKALGLTVEPQISVETINGVLVAQVADEDLDIEEEDVEEIGEEEYPEAECASLGDDDIDDLDSIIEAPPAADTTPVTWYLVDIAVTDSSGQITWPLLTQDEYCIVELQAPEHHLIREDEQAKIVTKPTAGYGTQAVTVVNDSYYVLPNSGGAGTRDVYILGAAMLTVGGTWYLYNRKRCRRKEEPAK